MPRNPKSMTNSAFLEAALEGLLAQKARLEEQIEEVRRLLGRSPVLVPNPSSPVAPKAAKRQLSPAARRRIAAAQKRRWAEYRKTSARTSSRSAKVTAVAPGVEE